MKRDLFNNNKHGLTNMDNKKSILFLWSYWRWNLWDDIFLETILNFFPKEEFNVFINASNDSIIPSSIKEEISIIETDFFRWLTKKIKVLLKVDYVVYFWWDIFVELVWESFFRRVFYKMIIVNFISRLLLKKVYYIWVWVWNIVWFSLLLARTAAVLSNYIIFRDNVSAEKISLPSKKYIVLPDLVINYFNKKIQCKNKTNKLKVGLSLLYFIPNKEINFPILIFKIASLINSNKDLDFIFLPLFKSENEKHDDRWVNEYLKNYCNINTLEYSSAFEYIKKIQELDVVISARFHWSVLSILSWIPTIGLSYSPKVKNFFSENNLGKYCIDINDIENLSEILYDLILNRDNEIFQKASTNLLSHRNQYTEKIRQLF